MRRRALFPVILLSALPVFAQPGERQTEAKKDLQEGEGTDNTTIWKTANFVLLAGALGYLMAKRGGGFFESRTAGVRRGIDDAARLKRDAETRYAEIDERLRKLGSQIEELREEAKRESAAERERIRCDTERDLQRIQAQTRQEIEAGAKAARQELRAYGAELAVDLAATKLKTQLTPESDSDLVQGALRDLAQRSDGQAVRAS